MEQHCCVCGVAVRKGAAFCPECGASLQPAGWACPRCGGQNPQDAAFCGACGARKSDGVSDATTVMPPVQPQQTGHFPRPSAAPMAAQPQPPAWQGGASGGAQRSVLQDMRLWAAVIVLLILLAAGGGSYYYFNYMNEGNYIKQYSLAANAVGEIDGLLGSEVRAEKLKGAAANNVRQKLQARKNSFDDTAKDFAKRTPFKGYETQHADTISLLQKESALVDEIMTVLANPLDAQADEMIKTIREDIAARSDLGAKIQVQGANFVAAAELSSVPQQLALFVSAERKAEEERKRVEKEKSERLAAMNAFFSKMEELVNRYESAKTDLNDIMNSSYKNDIIWADYFRTVDRAKNTRQAFRNELKGIAAPAGAEDIKAELDNVLAHALTYCELKSQAAHLQFNRYYTNASKKEAEARAMDDDIQKEYAAFKSHFQEEKARLTAGGI